MVETVAHLEANYGSARGYCKAIGLEDEEIARIRSNFMVFPSSPFFFLL